MKKISLLSLICFGTLGILCESDAAQAQWPTVENKTVVLTRGAMMRLNLTKAAKAENIALIGKCSHMLTNDVRNMFYLVSRAEDAQQYVPAMNAARPDAAADAAVQPDQGLNDEELAGDQGDHQDGD